MRFDYRTIRTLAMPVVVGLVGASPAYMARGAAVGILTILASSPASAVSVPGASEAAAGAAISAQCAACHGDNGISADTNTPNLAGQHYEYLLTQLKAYHDGDRKNAIMNEMARSLTSQQMKDLAAYFANVSIKVGSASGKNGKARN
ncbi:hypothetical protein GCM10008024_41350 [Allgaiera indica]|uniref:Cytochrome c domain-containing protein n=1 Tax=Allgaiera indica TaxID=765699 RepID=A0AAN4UVH3_9RHOB|nr:c-type cytochrome [Allgaiera indica]GHE06614.1 hypothetical protein GCM10008024_41350 [Allgaiera indica]